MIVDYSALERIRSHNPRKLIVFTSGSYDLPHAGHAFFLEEARKQGEILVVTVGTDAEIKKNKGAGRPIMNETVRLKMIDTLKPVDYTFLTNRPATGENWLGPIREVFTVLRPDIYVVNADAGDIPERAAMAKQFGISMVVLGMDYPSTEDKISTTKIIEKIRGLSG